MPSKFAGWDEARFREAGFRVVPGAVARRGSFIGRNCVLMPSFTNIGAYVGENTMLDTWASVGSCAQVGANCHISAGTGIGGVLEPIGFNREISLALVPAMAAREVAVASLATTYAIDAKDDEAEAGLTGHVRKLRNEGTPGRGARCPNGNVERKRPCVLRSSGDVERAVCPPLCRPR